MTSRQCQDFESLGNGNPSLTASLTHPMGTSSASGEVYIRKLSCPLTSEKVLHGFYIRGCGISLGSDCGTRSREISNTRIPEQLRTGLVGTIFNEIEEKKRNPFFVQIHFQFHPISDMLIFDHLCSHFPNMQI